MTKDNQSYKEKLGGKDYCLVAQDKLEVRLEVLFTEKLKIKSLRYKLVFKFAGDTWWNS